MAATAQRPLNRTPEANSMKPERPILIGVSSCLLGELVRFDGGHKRDPFLVELLGQYVEWVPVCPEFEIGLGVPRETLRLERKENQIHLIAPKSGADHTRSMRVWANGCLRQLAQKDLSGYVLKSKSPSCGMERVRVYDQNGVPSRDGRGIFAEALINRFGNLPVEEEGRLHDPRLRENFIERVFAYHRLQDLFSGRWGLRQIVEFHTRHKLLLMAHSPKHYSALGRLVAGAKKAPRKEFRSQYESDFMAAMSVRATAGRHVNVMQHMIGYLTEHLDPDSRQELLALIEDYRRRMIPLVVPLTLLRHYVRRFHVEYLQGQTYLEPHPKELMLRNHV